MDLLLELLLELLLVLLLLLLMYVITSAFLLLSSNIAWHIELHK